MTYSPASSDISPIVLVVEDYEPNLMVAEILLEQAGYRMDGVANGYAAIEKIKGGNRYAAILMDVKMEGLNGLATTQHIRDIETKDALPKTPILGLTAHMLPGTREACLSAGMNDFMTKPYTPEGLKERLEKLIV